MTPLKNRCYPLLFSALLLFLAACGQNPQPAASTPSTPGFSFAIDPATGSAMLSSTGSAALTALAADECRVLVPDKDLKVSSMTPTFLPNNILKLEVAFENVTKSDYQSALAFSEADSTKNVVSTTEPTVTDADLGSDGILDPGEKTESLTFTVKHKGQAFDYYVFARAVASENKVKSDANCGGTGPVSDGADLKVTQTDAQDPVVIDPNKEEFPEYTYTVTVKNIGDEAANEVELTDNFEMSPPYPYALSSEMPDGCAYASEPEPEDDGVWNPSSSSIVCDLGTLDSGASKDYTFTFSPAFKDIRGLADEVSPAQEEEQSYTGTNTATVTTTSPEANTDNNTSVEDTTATFGESDGLVDLAITQEAPETAQVGESVYYDITVTNNGPQTATGVKVVDRLYFEDGAILIGENSFCGYNGESGSDERGDYKETVCILGNIPAGEKSTFYYYADFDGPGTATNRVEVSANEFDPNGGDNADEVTTIITPADEQEPEACTNPTDPVSIPDGNLEQAIRDQLEKQKDEDITCEDMASLNGLTADVKGIGNLEGLQYATNLTSLALGNNQISDISVLSELTSLVDLFLGKNQISDLSPLEKLVNLQQLPRLLPKEEFRVNEIMNGYFEINSGSK